MKYAGLSKAAEVSLIALAKAGDQAAFAELVLRRQGRVRDLLRRLCGDRDLADDLAQLVFLQVWRNLKSLDKPGAFGGWLRQVAINVWRQEIRKGRLPISDMPDEVLAQAPDPTRSHVGAADRIDLDRALRRLGEIERLCLVLNYVEGLSHGDIAETTGLPLGTVKSHIARAGEKLRGWLAIGDVND